MLNVAIAFGRAVLILLIVVRFAPYGRKNQQQSDLQHVATVGKTTTAPAEGYLPVNSAGASW